MRNKILSVSGVNIRGLLSKKIISSLICITFRLFYYNVAMLQAGIFYVTLLLVIGTTSLFFAFDCPYMAEITPGAVEYQLNFTYSQCCGSVKFWYGSGSVPRTTGFWSGAGFRRPKNKRILRIWIRNTASSAVYKNPFWVAARMFSCAYICPFRYFLLDLYMNHPGCKARICKFFPSLFLRSLYDFVRYPSPS